MTKQSNKFKCPECGRSDFPTAAELGKHRYFAHKIPGSSSTAKNRRGEHKRGPIEGKWPYTRRTPKQEPEGACIFCPRCGLNLKVLSQAMDIANMKEFKNA